MKTSPVIFDYAQTERQKARAARGDWAHHRFLFDECALRLGDRLDDIARRFPRVVEYGAKGGEISRILGEHPKIGHITTWETTGFNAVFAPEVTLSHPEMLPEPAEPFDAAISSLSLSTINDVPGVLAQLRRHLKPDGLFLGMIFGGRTLQELRDCLTRASLEILGGISPHIHPFIDVRDAGSLLQRAGFSLPVVDAEVLTVTYDSLFRLCYDLRLMGLGNGLAERKKNFTPSAVFVRAEELYRETYADEEDRLPASFELVTLTAWVPDESQQQPAKRGSGTVSLKDALK